LSRTPRRIAVALIAATLGAIAALPAGQPARDRAVSHSRPQFALAAYAVPVMRTQWQDQALHADRLKLWRLERQAARERARLRREREARLLAAERAEQAAERAQQASVAAAGADSQEATPPPAASGSPQEIAEGMLGSYGWSDGQFGCLVSLWNAESGWNVYATNPSSGAYGIAQALPASKYASAGPDWTNNAATQIKWGLQYLKEMYGDPCNGWAHEEADGWY